MPNVNPEILVWARETAGLSQPDAATKLGFQDSRSSSAVDKMVALETGVKEPTRPQIVKMADVYHRPLLTFYLSKPPPKGNRGIDFRTLSSEHTPSDDALLDTLVRDITARQSMVRAILEDEEEADRLSFVGSCSMEDGLPTVLESLRSVLGVTLTAFRSERSASDAFHLLREGAEDAGVFVLLKGDLGNYRSAIDVNVFRGFSIADTVAPFLVINDQDARPAWSFTLLHETVHIILGQTGVSSEYSDNEVERFCDQVAAEFLLPGNELLKLNLNESNDLITISARISQFAAETNVSRTMVAYHAYRSDLISQEYFRQLNAAFRAQWKEEREKVRALAREREGGPSFYLVRRHRLGTKMTEFVRTMMASDALSTSKAARLLGVRPRQVEPLLDANGAF